VITIISGLGSPSISRKSALKRTTDPTSSPLEICLRLALLVEEDVVHAVVELEAVSWLFSLGQSDSSSLKEEDGACEDFLSKENRFHFVMSGAGLPGVALVSR
jgi:hypothetical protein